MRAPAPPADMTRMWCVFELAAFAKRASMERMVVLPIWVALLKGAVKMKTVAPEMSLETARL